MEPSSTAQRLKYSTDTVEAIAREVGYTSEYAFNRAFAGTAASRRPLPAARERRANGNHRGTGAVRPPRSRGPPLAWSTTAVNVSSTHGSAGLPSRSLSYSYRAAGSCPSKSPDARSPRRTSVRAVATPIFGNCLNSRSLIPPDRRTP